MKNKMREAIENDTFLKLVQKNLMPLLEKHDSSKCGRAYLVGGYIRDLALFNTVSPDKDIVLFDCDTEAVARKIADNIGGAFVELDCENKIYRVVLDENYADIAQGLNNSVDDDIQRRDFTINSIFYDFKNREFYDKNGGLSDLEKKVIKTCDIKNLEDDPLRMLRALRFQAQLGFTMDDEILKYIQKNGENLDTVAKERINQEILKMFEGEFLPETLLNMYDAGFLEIVFPFIKNIKKIPPNTHHHLDLVHHSIETVKQIRSKGNNSALLRLAALYHDIGKPLCWTIEPDSGRHRFIGHDEKGEKLVKKELSDLKFSKKQIEYVSKMVKNHIYPSSLMSTQEGASSKAMARFVRKIHPDVEDLIELARADRLSARGEAVSDDMVENNLANLKKLLEYYENIKESLKELPKLLDGREIMEILQIQATPKLGVIINELREAQIAGIVKSKEDAISFIKGLIIQ